MKVLIIGGGVAGVTVAKALREKAPVGSGVDIDIHTDEPVHYYYRPKLPDYLSGKAGLPEITAYAGEWYDVMGIGYHTGSHVSRIMAPEKLVRLQDGSEYPYDDLVLATGADSFIPDIPGSHAAGVSGLRSRDDADSILAYMEAVNVRQAVLVGGGLLGLETAAALVKRGIGVTVLEVAGRLLPRQLDEQGAGIFKRIVEGLGMTVRVDVKVTGFIQGPHGLSEVLFVDRYGNEEAINAQLAVISAGMAPRTQLAADAGLEIHRGIVVDSHMCTSVPGIHAVGDCAEHNGRLYGIVTAALEQGKAAAAHILDPEGAPEYPGSTHQTTLKIVGCDVTSIGNIEGGQGVGEAWREDVESGKYRKLFFASDGSLAGAILIGSKTGLGRIAAAINSRTELGREAIEGFLEF